MANCQDGSGTTTYCYCAGSTLLFAMEGKSFPFVLHTDASSSFMDRGALENLNQSSVVKSVEKATSFWASKEANRSERALWIIV